MRIIRGSIIFYTSIIILVVLNSYLLSSPNLLGRIGLFIYKHHYLRTFPRTLLTVGLLSAGAIAISRATRLLVARKRISRTSGMIMMLLLILINVVLLVRIVSDFSVWSYSHTGLRFRLGAYLLPVVLILIFGNEAWRLKKERSRTRIFEDTRVEIENEHF